MAPPGSSIYSGNDVDDDEYVAMSSDEEEEDEGAAEELVLCNIVAAPHEEAAEAGQRQQGKQYAIAHKGRQRQPSGDPRPLLLFDLNGVLMHHRFNGTSHHHDLRPGVHHLLRLCRHYRLGVFSSATRRTVLAALQKLHGNLEQALRQFPAKLRHEVPESMPEQLFEVVLCREHCRPAAKEDIEARGGKPWDTVKPLASHFADLARVLLVDDSPHKAVPEEAANMLVVPAWAGPPDGAAAAAAPGGSSAQPPQDSGLKLLAEELLARAAAAAQDVRAVAGEVSRRLLAAVGNPAASPAARALAAAAPAAPLEARPLAATVQRHAAAQAAVAARDAAARAAAAAAAGALGTAAAAPLAVLARAAAAELEGDGFASLQEINEVLKLGWEHPAALLVGNSAKAALAAALAAGAVGEAAAPVPGGAGGVEGGPGQGNKKKMGGGAAAAGLRRFCLVAGAEATCAPPGPERLEQIRSYCARFASRAAFLAARIASAQPAGGSRGSASKKRKRAAVRAAAAAQAQEQEQGQGQAPALPGGFFWEQSEQGQGQDQQAQQAQQPPPPQQQQAASQQQPGRPDVDAMARDLLLHALATLAVRRGAPAPAVAAAALRRLLERRPELEEASRVKKRKRGLAGVVLARLQAAADAAVAACREDASLVPGTAPGQQQLLRPAGPPPAAAEVEAALAALEAALAATGAAIAAAEAAAGEGGAPQREQAAVAEGAVAPAVPPVGEAGAHPKRRRVDAAPPAAAAAEQAAGPLGAAQGAAPAHEEMILLEVFEDRGAPGAPAGAPAPGPSEPATEAAAAATAAAAAAPPRPVVARGLPRKKAWKLMRQLGLGEGQFVAMQGQGEGLELSRRMQLMLTEAQRGWVGAPPLEVLLAPAVAAGARAAAGGPKGQDPAKRQARHRQTAEALGLSLEEFDGMTEEEVRALKRVAKKVKKAAARRRGKDAQELLDRLFEAAAGAPPAGAGAAPVPARDLPAAWAAACAELTSEQRRLLADHGVDLDQYFAEVILRQGAGQPGAAEAEAEEEEEEGEEEGEEVEVEVEVEAAAAPQGAAAGPPPLFFEAAAAEPAAPAPQAQPASPPPQAPQWQQQQQQQQQGQEQGQGQGAPPLSPLHFEVEAFAAAATPTAAEVAGVAAAVGAVDAAARGLWPGSTTVLFGSQGGGDLGALLWGFFQRFGTGFSYARQAVSLRAGGFCGKIKAWRQARRPWLLAVEDPQEPGRDVGSGTYAIRGARRHGGRGAAAQIQAEFAAAAGQLAETCEDLDANNAAAAAAVAAAAGPSPSPSPAATSGGGGGGGTRLLSGVVDWEMAVGRGARAERLRRAVEERAAARSAAVKHERIKRGIKVAARARPGGKPSKRRGAPEGGGPAAAVRQRQAEQAAGGGGGGGGKKRGSKAGRQVEAAWGNKAGQFHEDSDGGAARQARKQAKQAKQGQQRQQGSGGGGAPRKGKVAQARKKEKQRARKAAAAGGGGAPAKKQRQQ
eukprot:scaffold4.g4854.t1